jgi:hypothetical protein
VRIEFYAAGSGGDRIRIAVLFVNDDGFAADADFIIIVVLVIDVLRIQMGVVDIGAVAFAASAP